MHIALYIIAFYKFEILDKSCGRKKSIDKKILLLYLLNNGENFALSK